MPRYNVTNNKGEWACFSSVADGFITDFMPKDEYEKWRKKEYGKDYEPLEYCNQMDYEEAMRISLCRQREEESEIVSDCDNCEYWNEDEHKCQIVESKGVIQMDKNLKTIDFRIQRQNNLNKVKYDDTIGAGNGRHYYEIENAESGQTVAQIQFQQGARNVEGSIAGVLEGDLLEIVRHRLQCFQNGEFATRENACALTHIEEALMWLAKRADDRAERNVLGTYQK
jgi:hypothetical protein